MKQSTLILIVCLMVLGIAGIVYSRWDKLGEPPVKGSDIALLIDNSSSSNVDCAAVGALAGNEIDGLTVGKASHLMLFTLGDATNSFEPKPQLDIQLKPGPGGKRRAVRAVTKACGNFGVIDSSSIFRGVELTLNQLQARGLSGDKFVLQSDLEENVDIRQQHKVTKKTALLNNAGVNTLVCGIGVTNAGGPRGAHADRLEATWKAGFTEPKRVSMQPFCPGQGNSERASR